MQAAYPANYRDALGEEQTVIENDGRMLRMVVRGVEFEGSDFDGFEPIKIGPSLQCPQFVLNHNELCACTIICDIPVPVVRQGEVGIGRLHVQLELGMPAERGHISHELLRLELITGEETFISRRKSSGFFELELLDIQRLMPVTTYMKCCFNCTFAGYSPSGNGMWRMYCHRNHKEEYPRARGKAEWFRLNGEAAEIVQETYLCPEFERWDGKTGYRDPLHLPVINQL